MFENRSREIPTPPLKLYFLTFPTGHMKVSFLSYSPLLEHRKHQPSNFSSWALSQPGKSLQILSNWASSLFHIYSKVDSCFLDGPEDFVSNSWGHVSGGALRQEVQRMCQRPFCLVPTRCTGEGVCRESPAGQPVPSKLPKLSPFTRDGSPARFTSGGN